MGDDPQRIKKVAASTYDYDNDPRWADYWSNILVPPHMASRPEVVQHYKHKFYQRYIKPRAWNLQAIQVWLQSLMATKDFLYLLYCFVFVSSPMPIKCKHICTFVI